MLSGACCGVGMSELVSVMDGDAYVTDDKSALKYVEDERWRSWENFAHQCGDSLKYSFEIIEEKYSKRSPTQKRSILLSMIIWAQMKDFLQSCPRDVCSVIHHTVFELLKAEITCHPFDVNAPIPPLLDFQEIKLWLDTRVFKETTKPPVDHVYQWLFHWLGFNPENWWSRDRNLSIAFNLTFLRQLIQQNIFFFGFGAKEANVHLANEDIGTFMLRLSQTQTSAFTVTYVPAKKSTHNTRLNLIGGFLLYEGGWSYQAIRDAASLIQDSQNNKRPHGGKLGLRHALRTEDGAPQYSNIYLESTSQ